MRNGYDRKLHALSFPTIPNLPGRCVGSWQNSNDSLKTLLSSSSKREERFVGVFSHFTSFSSAKDYAPRLVDALTC